MKLPEKVLQFGTGILLRGLPDYFISEANHRNIFNGTIVMVKSMPGSTHTPGVSRFTICVRGLDRGKKVEENLINDSIARVLEAQTDWEEVLKVAANPDVQLIISNTTEVGIQWVNESIHQTPPVSFPAKLAACLFERFTRLGATSPMMIVVPTELIPDNGTLLRKIVIQISTDNQLGDAFLNWLSDHIIFCNSLVDRIVTRPSERVSESVADHSPWTIQTEPYRLWAIEGGPEVRSLLSFASVDSSVIIEDDIQFYRERKLRLLNGGGTMMACLGYLQGLRTVYECLSDRQMGTYVEQLLMDEIEPTLPEATRKETIQFARDVMERWRNEYTVHHLINITLQGTAKMKMRNVPTFIRYVEKFNKLPDLMVKGFAAHLLFMKSTHQEGDRYFGTSRGESYPIQDDRAPLFHAAWRQVESTSPSSLLSLVEKIARNTDLWDRDLTQLPKFTELAANHLKYLIP